MFPLCGHIIKFRIIRQPNYCSWAVLERKTMNYNLAPEDQKWLMETGKKLEQKLETVYHRIGSWIPSVTADGKYQTDMGEKDITDWVNGFWGGMMWQIYHASGKDLFLKAARDVEERLDQAFLVYDGLHHDVGFMWLPTAVADYSVTGDRKARTRGLHAANLLAGRYNPRAEFIRAWNPHVRSGKEEDCIGWMIVDSLMNLPILFWAAEEAKNPAYRYIAEKHADTAMKYILREDGSCNHIVVLDHENGGMLRVQEGQGYSVDSAWSRGQAWAIYGLAVCAKYTGKKEYLNAAKRVANYFIACTDKTGHISVCDFRAPKEPFLPDTSAGVCAACGMLEIAEQLNEYEAEFYIGSALNILKATEQKYADWNPETDGIIRGGRGSYHSDEPEEGRTFIFGEYYFTEGILRLMNKYLPIW